MFRAFYKYYRHLVKAIQTLQKLILNYPQSVTRTLNTKWNTEHFREIVHSFCCAYRQLFNFSLQIRFNKLCRRRQFCLECSGQYSVLIKIHIVTGNEKLCKIYFKKLFFQNVLVFIDLITPVISSTQTACGAICVQHVIQLIFIAYKKRAFFNEEFLL